MHPTEFKHRGPLLRTPRHPPLRPTPDRSARRLRRARPVVRDAQPRHHRPLRMHDDPDARRGGRGPRHVRQTDTPEVQAPEDFPAPRSRRISVAVAAGGGDPARLGMGVPPRAARRGRLHREKRTACLRGRLLPGPDKRPAACRPTHPAGVRHRPPVPLPECREPPHPAGQPAQQARECDEPGQRLLHRQGAVRSRTHTPPGDGRHLPLLHAHAGQHEEPAPDRDERRRQTECATVGAYAQAACAVRPHARGVPGFAQDSTGLLLQLEEEARPCLQTKRPRKKK